MMRHDVETGDGCGAEAPDSGRPPRLARRAACLLVGVVCALLLASVAVAPVIAPYHLRVRGVYLTLAPLTAGFLFGALCPEVARKRGRLLFALAAVTLLVALLPRLRVDVPAASVYPILLMGAVVALAFVRLGLFQAGIGWRGLPMAELLLPRWMAVLAYAFAWAWLLTAILCPRESFAPTRWLLIALGSRPADSTLAPPQVHFKEYAVSGRAMSPERGRVAVGDYVFSVGPLSAQGGEILVGISAARRDDAPFRRPMWLTVDADDPGGQDAENDAEFYDVATVDGGTPEGQALRRSATARLFTTYAWFTTTQSLPAVRLRARLWTLDREAGLGELHFRPVAEADLGVWDLTVLSHFRPQPARRGPSRT